LDFFPWIAILGLSVEVDCISLRGLMGGVRTVLNRVTPVRFEIARLPSETLEEIVVSARAVERDPFAAANAVALDRESLRRNPGSAGDVFRALDVLPGVVATGEFSNFTVRGNGPRDNLILVDGIPFGKVVPFDQSLGEQEDIGGGGRFSIFAPNLIGRARFSPGGWRASASPGSPTPSSTASRSSASATASRSSRSMRPSATVAPSRTPASRRISRTCRSSRPTRTTTCSASRGGGRSPAAGSCATRCTSAAATRTARRARRNSNSVHRCPLSSRFPCAIRSC
jgi:hypothetical protein